MDAGPDALRADLGPISPELALVDPELARRARELLPELQERPRPPRPVRPALAPEPATQPEVRRRWRRALALAVAIFVAGAVSGTFLGNYQSGSPTTQLEVRAVAPAQTTATHAALRPPKASRTTTAPSAPRRQQRRHAQVAWASNVLGVEATVSRRGAALVWARPAGSARVVVLRRRSGRSSSVVVYRGRATSYRDASLRPCTGYRYTIVNYDWRGHRSTGVPTSVVTRCT